MMYAKTTEARTQLPAARAPAVSRVTAGSRRRLHFAIWGLTLITNRSRLTGDGRAHCRQGLLATASDDRIVRTWDPRTRVQRANLNRHRDGATVYARSRSTARSCSPAQSTTARCGSGILPPASSGPPSKAIRTGSTESARSPSTTRPWSPPPAPTAQCGSGPP